MGTKEGVEYTNHVVVIIWPRGCRDGYISDAFVRSPLKISKASFDFCADGECTGLVTVREILAIKVRSSIFGGTTSIAYRIQKLIESVSEHRHSQKDSDYIEQRNEQT